MNKKLFEKDFNKKGIFIDDVEYTTFIKQNISTEPDFPRLVIVSYLPNKKAIKLLRLCLETIKKFTKIPHEVWVVDNNSPTENIEWLFDNKEINVVFSRTNPKEQGSYANAIGLEIAVRCIDPNSKYLMALHQDIAVCKNGWLEYLLSKFNEKIKAVGVFLDNSRIPEGILHVYGYILDFQLYKKLGLSFFPELPTYDVGDKAIHELKKNGYEIFATPNTFLEKEAEEMISKDSPFKTISFNRSLDDDEDVIFMHLGRGIPRSQGQRITNNKSIEIWEDFIEEKVLENKDFFPKVTIAILSWNRLHYLKSTLESAKECIQYPNLEWIVLDNCSTEKGLREYLESLTWIDRLIFLKSTHVEAMNEIIRESTGEIILIWPEDVQFVFKGDWMKDCVELLKNNKYVGSICMNFLRGITNQKHFSWKRFLRIRDFMNEIIRYGINFRMQKMVETSRGRLFKTFGWTADGIIGSGIPSLSRKNMWLTLGPWKTTEKRSEKNIIDSSLGGEAEMLLRWRNSKIPWQRAIPIIPFAADIINDDIGTKAKIRGNKRYGIYASPKNGKFYYKIKTLDVIKNLSDKKFPVGFEKFVEPNGFQLPLDENGNLKKSPINMSEINNIT